MFATIISRALFYYAFHAGAADAEDVAQDVIVNLLRRPCWVESNMPSYLRVAVRNQMCRRWRTAPEREPLRLDFERLTVPEPKNDDAPVDVDCLIAEDPGLVAFLIDYSEGQNHGGTDRARASRGRRKLREVLAT